MKTNVIKKIIKSVALCGILSVLGGTARSAITYVDVKDGASANTMALSNGVYQAWTAFNGQTSVANDGIWDRRAFGNSSTIFQNSGSSLVDTNAARLKTTVTVPLPGTNQYYNVYALFWTDGSLWRLGASLNDSPGQLPVYAASVAGVTTLYTPTGSVSASSGSLTPNPFTSSVLVADTTRRLLMTPVLGEVYGTNITVYLEPDRSQTGQDTRTWLDGIGYELISNTILNPVVLTNGDLSISYKGTAGRQYLLEKTGSLTPPVMWSFLDSVTADASGMVNITNTPVSSPEFYRIHDVTPPPAPVINLVATAGDTQVTLNWTVSPLATRFNVKSSTTSGGPYTTIANLYGTSFVNTGLTDGTTYYYVVSAINYNGEGVNSPEVSATPRPPQPPSPPVLAAMAGNNLVLLNWTAPATATSYNVKSSATSGGPYTTITNVTTTGFVDFTAVNGTASYYVVSALNPYGEGVNSAEASATPAPVAPTTPTALATIAGNTQVTVSWTASPGATSYNIKSSTTSGGPYTTITNVTTTNFVDTGLSNATAYYFVVSAVNAFGESADTSEKISTPFDTPPLVYSVEFTGTNFPAPPLPALGAGPAIQPLPDPFTYGNDPFNIMGTRSTSFYDWSHHRAEFKAEIENYEIGLKPAVDPTNISASYSASSATAGTLTVRVTNIVAGVPKTLTLTCAISLPSSGTGPFPAIIGMNSPNGSVNSSILTAVAKITYSHNQVTTYGNPQNTDPYYQLYTNLNINNTGQYSAWAWGVSRIIDGLYMVTNTLPIDLQHIGVTGCSYAGKMALFCGAFDERVALTIAQESGGGGAPSWRYSATEPAGSVEAINQTDHNWFSEGMFTFGGTNVAYLPEDHHMLMAMVAPRALFATGNPDVSWLSNPSCYVSCKTVEQIYGTFGIPDRFGYNIVGGHGHCATTTGIDTDMAAFVNRFLLSQTNVNTTIRDFDSGLSTINYSRWYNWWGTTNAVFGP